MPPDVASFGGDLTVPKIFLGLAAYRDTLRCARTLRADLARVAAETAQRDG